MAIVVGRNRLEERIVIRLAKATAEPVAHAAADNVDAGIWRRCLRQRELAAAVAARLTVKGDHSAATLMVGDRQSEVTVATLLACCDIAHQIC